MSTLAKIIYEETGLTESGTPDEYEEVAAACRRFAMHDTETTDDTDDTALLRQALNAMENTSPLGFNMESDKRFFATVTALRARLGGQQ